MNQNEQGNSRHGHTGAGGEHDGGGSEGNYNTERHGKRGRPGPIGSDDGLQEDEHVRRRRRGAEARGGQERDGADAHVLEVLRGGVSETQGAAEEPVRGLHQKGGICPDIPAPRHAVPPRHSTATAATTTAQQAVPDAISGTGPDPVLSHAAADGRGSDTGSPCAIDAPGGRRCAAGADPLQCTVCRRPLIVSRRNLSCNRPPEYVRIVDVKQRTPLWLSLRPGKTGERVGSSGAADAPGAGEGRPRDYVLQMGYRGKEPTVVNWFMQRGTEYEPCPRMLLEHIIGERVYDGGYWIPLSEELREYEADSPDFVTARRDVLTGEMVISGVGELKFPVSHKTFDNGYVCMAHIIQCHRHMVATGSATCHYLALLADESPHGEYGPDYPEVKKALYAIINYNDELMQLVRRRERQARIAIHATAACPDSPLVPGWGMLKYNGVEQTVDYTPEAGIAYVRKREIKLQILYVPVDVQKINESRLLMGWRSQPDPEGMEWTASDGIYSTDL